MTAQYTWQDIEKHWEWCKMMNARGAGARHLDPDDVDFLFKELRRLNEAYTDMLYSDRRGGC